MEDSAPSSVPGKPRPSLHFQAFGHSLSSNIEFPELRPLAPGPTRWTFDAVSSGDALSSGTGTVGGELLGREPLYGDVSARLYRTREGFRVEVDDTGTYEMSDDGRRIRWFPTPEPWWDFGRGHLLGRVLSTSLHFEGLLVLHGSAVLTRDGVVAFLGEKGAGKTTLALALVDAGAKLVTDDTLAIDVTSGSLVWPGVHSLRLGPESTTADALDEREPGRDGKVTTPPLPTDSTMEAPAPLRAIYLLQPGVSSNPDMVALRVALDPLRATAALAGFSKIRRMLGPGEASALLDRAAVVSASVPVRSLLVHRSAKDLPSVVRQLSEWHELSPRDSAR